MFVLIVENVLGRIAWLEIVDGCVTIKPYAPTLVLDVTFNCWPLIVSEPS